MSDDSLPPVNQRAGDALQPLPELRRHDPDQPAITSQGSPVDGSTSGSGRIAASLEKMLGCLTLFLTPLTGVKG